MRYPLLDPQSKYKIELDKKLIDWMSQGYSFASFGAEIGAGRSSLYRWLKKHPSFREAYELGYCKSLKYYEEHLLSCLHGLSGRKIQKSIRKIDYKTLSFILRTRFREIYSEKYKIDVEIDNKEQDRLNIAELSNEELDKEIKRLEEEGRKYEEMLKDINSPDPFS